MHGMGGGECEARVLDMCGWGGGHAWQGGMHWGAWAVAVWGGWQLACMAGGCTWQGGVHGGGPAWQEKWPLQRAIRILLECILVVN